MEFKGTKGKWIIKYSDRDNSYDVVTKESFIASTLNASNESKINALLISKAPEMLEMLKEIFKLINNNYDSEPELMKELGFDDKLFVKIEQLINSATNF